MSPLITGTTVALISAFASLVVAAAALVKLFIDAPSTKANAVKAISEAAGTQLTNLQGQLSNTQTRLDGMQRRLDVAEEARDIAEDNARVTRRLYLTLLDFIRSRQAYDDAHPHLVKPGYDPPRINIDEYVVTQQPPQHPASPA